MSQRAILLAVRNDLRTYLATGSTQFPAALSSDQIEITFDGRPLPIHAEQFVAIWPSSWTNQYDEGIHEEFGVNITASIKGGKVPTDRWGPEMMTKAASGLDVLLELIRARVHSNYTIMAAANVFITASYNGFVRPLFFRDGGRPEKKAGSWWGAKGKEQSGGLAQTLRFAGAERVQTIESQT